MTFEDDLKDLFYSSLVCLVRLYEFKLIVMNRSGDRYEDDLKEIQGFIDILCLAGAQTANRFARKGMQECGC